MLFCPNEILPWFCSVPKRYSHGAVLLPMRSSHDAVLTWNSIFKTPPISTSLSMLCTAAWFDLIRHSLEERKLQLPSQKISQQFASITSHCAEISKAWLLDNAVMCLFKINTCKFKQQNRNLTFHTVILNVLIKKTSSGYLNWVPDTFLCHARFSLLK